MATLATTAIATSTALETITLQHDQYFQKVFCVDMTLSTIKWIASLFLPTNGIESAMVCALPTSPRNASALLGSLCHILNPSLAPLPHVSAPWLLVGQNTNELRASSWTMKLHVMKMMEWPPPFFFRTGDCERAKNTQKYRTKQLDQHTSHSLPKPKKNKQ